MPLRISTQPKLLTSPGGTKSPEDPFKSGLHAAGARITFVSMEAAWPDGSNAAKLALSSVTTWNWPEAGASRRCSSRR